LLVVFIKPNDHIVCDQAIGHPLLFQSLHAL